jgi:hypothetical protein
MMRAEREILARAVAIPAQRRLPNARLNRDLPSDAACAPAERVPYTLTTSFETRSQ